jgi:hypothetical protein
MGITECDEGEDGDEGDDGLPPIIVLFIWGAAS